MEESAAASGKERGLLCTQKHFAAPLRGHADYICTVIAEHSTVGATALGPCALDQALAQAGALAGALRPEPDRVAAAATQARDAGRKQSAARKRRSRHLQAVPVRTVISKRHSLASAERRDQPS